MVSLHPLETVNKSRCKCALTFAICSGVGGFLESVLRAFLVGGCVSAGSVNGLLAEFIFW